ncbi:MAG TPA: redoxin domain-containing protein [Terriglobales bacterium]|nr:redoxin domain-containing protein [Terriglobales bacterium]
MSLKDTLDTLRAASQTRIPPETRAVMHRAVEDLRASGILDRVLRTGQQAPDFTLPNTDGRPIRLGELLGRGPVILSFFRGRW